MAENVRVVVRCRPMNEREISLKCKNIIEISSCALTVSNPIETNAPEKDFTFDNVYGPEETTESLYNDVCYTLVENVLEGYNGTIFAYGQTGCGKTHTMQGPDDANMQNLKNTERGIISRSFDHIFEAISVASGVRYLAYVSYLEIYNENIRDLLNPNETFSSNHALKEVPGIGVSVPSLSTHTVLSAKECHQFLNAGNRNRMVGATLMNATSSRSHSIFTIDLEQIVEDETESKITEKRGSIRRGKLNLVDLAGSERQNKTGATGDRLKEASKINLSLSALGNVISALVDGKTKHIPYRDSKLTRLLQDSLGGNTKTLMIACISPADNNYDETLSTLRYASRAKNIANKPKLSINPQDAKLREYQEEILKLKRMLQESNIALPSAGIVTSELDKEWVEKERLKLRKEMDLEIESLKEEHFRQQRAKDEQMREITDLQKNYEEQLRRLNAFENVEGTYEEGQKELLQLEARKRIEAIKRALIGGERAHDVQLKERRQKKKLDAQRRLSALAQALSRIDESEDRDILQAHYTDIQEELHNKNEYLKKYRQKIKALEREVSDLQVEFQMDRADYLDSIRRLECNLKFYQQLIDKALPILRKDGKYWDPDHILQNSTWNDDLKTWKLPQTTLNSFRLPLTTTKKTDNNTETEEFKNNPDVQELNTVNRVDDILNNYFRSERQKSKELVQQRKSFNNWKDFMNRRQQFKIACEQRRGSNEFGGDETGIQRRNRVSTSWERTRAVALNTLLMNKTWTGANGIIVNNTKTSSDTRQQFLQPLEFSTFINEE